MRWIGSLDEDDLTLADRHIFVQIRHDPRHRLDFRRKEPGQQQVLKRPVRAQERAGDFDR